MIYRGSRIRVGPGRISSVWIGAEDWTEYFYGASDQSFFSFGVGGVAMLQCQELNRAVIWRE